MTTRQGVVRSTGEVLDVEFPATRARRRRGRRKVYAMVDLEVISDLELSGAEWRVLGRIMRAVHPETNLASVTARTIAEDLQLDESNVAKVIRALHTRHILETKTRGVHRVNPHIMYRGSNQDWDIATETYPEPIWRRA